MLSAELELGSGAKLSDPLVIAPRLSDNRETKYVDNDEVDPSFQTLVAPLKCTISNVQDTMQR